jgi:DNA adenine methylase
MVSPRAVEELARTPMLRWAGSKRKLLPYLLRCVPEFDRYVEPFAGSACLFFALKPAKALLGDFNEELIQVYETVRDHPKEVGDRLNAMPASADFYYEIRSSPVKRAGYIDRAARFIYLNRYCFNGVYRTNRQGIFNVPRGIRTGRVPSTPMFLTWANALRSARFVAGDFGRCLARVRKGDFVYLDPPYTKLNSRYSGEYGYGSFAEKDLKRLLGWLQRMDAKGARFLVSYRHSRNLAKQFHEWNTRTITVRRHVAGFLKSRVTVKELLISNAPLPRVRG